MNQYHMYDQDNGAPEIRVIATRNHRVRVPRKLNCGHNAPVGLRYTRTVLILDDEFTVSDECEICYAELVGEPEDVERIYGKNRR